MQTTKNEVIPVVATGLLVAALWQLEILFAWPWDYYFPFFVAGPAKWLARDFWYLVILICFTALWWWGRGE